MSSTPNSAPPNCDPFLDAYMQCVRSKRGLSHVDDCPDEADSYKTCIETEKALGVGLRQRYDRDSSFTQKFVDNFKEHWGIGHSLNPAHSSFIPPPNKED